MGEEQSSKDGISFDQSGILTTGPWLDKAVSGVVYAIKSILARH